MTSNEVASKFVNTQGEQIGYISPKQAKWLFDVYQKEGHNSKQVRNHGGWNTDGQFMHSASVTLKACGTFSDGRSWLAFWSGDMSQRANFEVGTSNAATAVERSK